MFSNRHIGPNEKEIKKMLNKLGVNSIKELIYETIPNDILLKKELELDDAISEIEFNNLIRNGIFDNQYGVCFPNYIVSYDREYLKIDDVRISIDKNLIYKNFNNKNYFKDNKSIVEIKTSINKNADELIKMFPLQRIRFSKYCFAVEALR